MFKTNDRVRLKCMTGSGEEIYIYDHVKYFDGDEQSYVLYNFPDMMYEEELELAPFELKRDLQDGHILTYEDGARSIFFNKLIEDGLWNICYDDRFEVSCPKFSKDGSSCDGFTFKKIMKIEQAFTGIVEWER